MTERLVIVGYLILKRRKVPWFYGTEKGLVIVGQRVNLYWFWEAKIPNRLVLVGEKQ